MWLDILQYLGHCYMFYRAAQDSGIWLFQAHSQDTQNYLESSLIAKGRL